MKRAAVVAIALLAAFPLALSAAFFSLGHGTTVPSRTALQEIPNDLIDLYQAAAATCKGLDWTVLAAIHHQETNFGTGQAISSAGAQGPMQFEPATFRQYATDGDGDGRADVNNVNDAVFSAATLLCQDGAGNPNRLRDAIYAYNHSWGYVDQVLAVAHTYGIPSSDSAYALAASASALHNHNLQLSPNARADIASGVIDPRVVTLLALISKRWSIYVSVLKAGHSRCVDGVDFMGCPVSNHYYGRAADISEVDGLAVTPANNGARRLVLWLRRLPRGLRPDEVGSPFAGISGPGFFSDSFHKTHIHIGWN